MVDLKDVVKSMNLQDDIISINPKNKRMMSTESRTEVLENYKCNS
jgi:hypothetical protein